MKVSSPLSLVALVVTALVACQGDGGPARKEGPTTAETTTPPSPSARARTSAVVTAEAPAGSGRLLPPEGSARAGGGGAATSRNEPEAGDVAKMSLGEAKRQWSCGNEGQPRCPMQGWMKRVMARAMSSGDTVKITEGLRVIASKPVDGYDEWTAIAEEGAAKAAEGDVRGAKKTCKKCHKLYQKRYIATMRDEPW